jgi:hypothetical protein
VLRGKKVRDLAALGRNRLGADLRRGTLRDAVEHFGELVAGVLADFLRDVGVVVVESLGGTESLDEGEVARAASGDDLAAREHSELNCQTAGRGAATVNEQWLVRLLGARQWESQALVQCLSDGGDTNTKRAGFLV